MGYVVHIVKPSLAQLVEHGTVVKNSGHPRVSGSSPERGILFFFTAPPVSTPAFFISFIRKICTAFQPDQNRIGDRSQQIVRVVVF